LRRLQTRSLLNERQCGQPALADCYFFGLQTLGSLFHNKLNLSAFIERSIARRLDRGEMNEDVLSRLSLDEAKSFGRIEPLHYTFFFHRNFLVKLFALLWVLPLDMRREGASTNRSLARCSKERTKCLDVQTPFDYNMLDSLEST
jgi:hypothetical protein